MVIQTAISIVVIAVILFFAAGDWRWPQGWLFIGELAVSAYALGFWLARNDPELLAARMSAPMQREQPVWDRIFIAIAGISFLLWMVLMAIDARRFRWSHMPAWLEGAGFVMVALCMLVAWRTFRVNSFAAPQVRIQQARSHRVITEGPYRWVRHPLYSGALLFFLGMPLLLGSWWGLLGAPIGAFGLGIRALGEERLLCDHLSGYDAYARRVRFRLVPWVW